ncbi:DNA-3-methyladenine glycosylase 2 family protein [Undibacterium sp. LX40W]|uniref:DNA-3-methyladenine glycosylase II n=1 Tax=Undibacterium nitidum TaxID=2762298 RepID=A0A923KUB5_9BURK|nr:MULTISPECIES: DNA-3-methyladenine glycosylase 2 [Undibacterium]MBC3883111.1 DNA-3-methyladenine glycosylase 2 family protein [Undibacterium nitidum]MBC3893393.1 DNA-3-methyladenine glycosylase 2 family protein [Undibacterium sp. LX40W]
MHQHSEYYRAMTAKDARFDGVFFAGIKTTGIYCRPICRVKTPKEESCLFFSTQAAAEAAGFRPCLRCRPELAPYALQQNLAHAIWRKIAAGVLNESSVEEFAQQIGLSSRQLRRVLVQEFGVSPVELAQTQRLLFAKKLIQETALSMTEIAFVAGFGSVRRFNALFESRYQMTPASIRRTAQPSSGELVLRLAYRPPYAWQELLSYLKGRAMLGLEEVDLEHSCYMRTVKIGDASGWIRVSHLSASQQLLVSVSSGLHKVLMPLIEGVRNQFDLEANPAMISQHLQQDPLLANQLDRTPGLRVPGAFDAFELAIRAILGQQVSVAGATTVAGRLVREFGEPVTSPWSSLSFHFPKPQILANASVDQIAGLGMPGKRAATIQSFAAFTVNGGLNFAPGLPLDEVIRTLKSLPGIGEWTAQYIAMRALRFPNAFPAGDLGLQKAVTSEGEARCNEKLLLQKSQRWAPWRSYAALLLWQSLAVTTE